MKKTKNKIRMTAAQLDWADWAVEPMFELWCTPEGAWARGEKLVLDESNLPAIVDNWLILNHPTTTEDLVYRLKVEAPRVSETDAGSDREVYDRMRAAISLAKKIKNNLQ